MKLKPAIVAPIAMLLLVNAASFSAQTRNRNRAPVTRPSQPVTTQTAVTKDGRTVLLKSDGTWEYTSDPPNPVESKPKVSTSARRNSNLSIEAGLVFRSGDIKPVARTTFYLLDAHPGNILKEAGVKPSDTGSGMDLEDPDKLAFSLGLAMRYAELPSERPFVSAAMEALKPHIIQTVTTDFGGKAQFSSVPAGSYYLFGVAQTPQGMALWNMKVDLNAGQNAVTLDQNNAAYAR